MDKKTDKQLDNNRKLCVHEKAEPKTVVNDSFEGNEDERTPYSPAELRRAEQALFSVMTPSSLKVPSQRPDRRAV